MNRTSQAEKIGDAVARAKPGSFTRVDVGKYERAKREAEERERGSLDEMLDSEELDKIDGPAELALRFQAAVRATQPARRAWPKPRRRN